MYIYIFIIIHMVFISKTNKKFLKIQLLYSYKDIQSLYFLFSSLCNLPLFRIVCILFILLNSLLLIFSQYLIIDALMCTVCSNKTCSFCQWFIFSLSLLLWIFSHNLLHVLQLCVISSSFSSFYLLFALLLFSSFQ